jgi:HEAT repeat protein
MPRNEPVDAVSVAAELEYGSGRAGEMAALIESLRMDRRQARIVLEDLSDHPSFSVRSWVPRAAKLVLQRDGVPLIKKLVRDRDPDVRDIAIEELLELDPAECRYLAPALRKRLKSRDVCSASPRSVGRLNRFL